jgi:hypothetical protein
VVYIVSLLFFLLGIIFIIFVYPIIDGVCSIILTQIEYIKGIYALKISKLNLQISSLDEDKETMNPIGFVISSDKDEGGNK